MNASKEVCRDCKVEPATERIGPTGKRLGSLHPGYCRTCLERRIRGYGSRETKLTLMLSASLLYWHRDRIRNGGDDDAWKASIMRETIAEAYTGSARKKRH